MKDVKLFALFILISNISLFSQTEYELLYNYYQNQVELDSSKVKQFERFKFYYEDKIDTARSLNGYVGALNHLVANLDCPNTDLAQFELIGPKTYTETGSNTVPFNGLVSAIVTDPNNPDYLFIGNPDSGIWKWKSSTREWKNVTDMLNIPGLGITDILLNPTNPQHIIASTGNHSESNPTVGVGLIESFDGGNTWQINQSFNPNRDVIKNLLYEINVIPQSINNNQFSFYVAYTERDGYSCDNNFVLRFDVSGTNTLHINTIQFNTNSHSLANPTDDCVGAQWNFQVIQDLEVIDYDHFIIGSRGLFTADSYLELYQGGTWTTIPIPTTQLFQKIVISNIHNNKCYLSIDHANNSNTGSRFIYELDLMTQQVTFVKELILLDANPSELIYSPTSNLLYIGAGNFNIFGILDLSSGSTKIFHRPDLHDDIRSMILYKESNSVEELYLGSDGGAHKVTVDVNNINNSYIQDYSGLFMPINQFFNTAVAQSRNEKYLASGMHQGVFNYNIQVPSNWLLDRVGDGISCAINPFNSNENYYQGNTTLYKNGSSLISTSGWHSGQSLKYDPNNPDIIYWTRVGKIRKIDQIGNITDINTVNTSKLGAIDISEKDGKIYVANSEALEGNKMKLEVYDGGSFTELDNLPNQYGSQTLRQALAYKRINDIAVDPHNPDIIYIAISGIETASGSVVPGQKRVLKSINGGITWTDCSAGLDATPCKSLVFQKGTFGRIFLANEYGVFYRDHTFADTDEWKCFHKGLPAVPITGLDINYCRQELIVSTFGRAAWKSNIDQLPFSHSYNRITSNTTWNNNRVIYDDVIVEPGVTLEINNNATIKFAAGKNLIVQPTGVLKISGGSHLTNLCEDMCWEGIVVEGMSNMQQTPAYQGQLLMNNGQISNAYYGVRATGVVESSITSSPGLSVDWSQMGGIINIAKSFFYNNGKSVEWSTFNSGPNVGIIKESNFLVDDNFFINCSSNFAMVSLWDVEAIRIEGCHFEDQRNNLPIFDHYRDGIFSLNATFSVEASQNRSSEFRGLKRGIVCQDVENTNLFATEIYNNNFYNCGTAIDLDNLNKRCFIRNNCILTGHFANQNNTLGIRSHNSSGYEIIENSLEKDNSYLGWSTGMDVYNTFNSINQDQNPFYSHHKISNNIIEGHNWGMKIWGDNRAGDNINNLSGPYDGLELTCNQFFNSTDVDINFSGSIKSNQGSNSNPAGNKFTCNGILAFSNHTGSVPISMQFNYFHGPSLTCLTSTNYINVISSANFTNCNYYNSICNFILSNKEENKNNSNFLIYPNPTGDIINLKYSDEMKNSSLVIYNSYGEKVNSLILDRKKIDISSLPNGIYFIVIKDKNNFLLSRKFIKI